MKDYVYTKYIRLSMQSCQDFLFQRKNILKR